MDQKTSDKPPSMRFLSFSNDKEDAEKEAKLKEAAARIEQAIARERSLNELVDCPTETNQEELVQPENDTRSLYERLQEQRNKKKETIEEAQKLSNFVAHLDEDDANYLNEVAKNRREEELRKRLEVMDALEAKKRLDEQKMDDQERRMRESLLGITSGSSARDSKSTKSRLSSMIKVKPKLKSKGESESDAMTKDQSDQHTQSNLGSASSPTKRPSDSHGQSSDEPANKRLSTDQVVGSKDGSASYEKPSEKDTSKQHCSCVKNVTRVLGVMPSSLIVKENPRDSDDSDNSDDNATVCRLMPVNRRKR